MNLKHINNQMQKRKKIPMLESYFVGYEMKNIEKEMEQLLYKEIS